MLGSWDLPQLLHKLCFVVSSKSAICGYLTEVCV